MGKDTGNQSRGQGSRQQAEVFADLCYRFVRPLLRRVCTQDGSAAGANISGFDAW